MSTDDVIDDVRKTARDAKRSATRQLSSVQDDFLTYTQEQPLTALLSAFIIGVVVGKMVL